MENSQEKHLNQKSQGPIETNENEKLANDADSANQKCIDMLKRLKADFDNYRRRSKKEKEELAVFVRSNLLLELLPVLDDFERLLDEESEDHRNLKKGAELIYNNLLSIFKQHGLESYSDKGQPFDPNWHDAISVVPSSIEGDGKILETWQKGYRINEKMLRPAKVRVGKFDMSE